MTTTTTTATRIPLQPIEQNTLQRNMKASDIAFIINKASAQTSVPTCKANNNNNIPAGQVLKPTDTSSCARKLKYRLRLAYYKLRTNQVNVPLTEIIMGQQEKHVTPSLTRHISLLAASTPLSQKKKRVAFTKSRSMYETLSPVVEAPSYSQSALPVKDTFNHNTNRQTVTPVKRSRDDNGDLIMSSPTKKLCSSTPGSYGAAKSLLQLSLISTN
ncbi:Nrm1p CYBJADRAFT_169574 [Cyberlindnera jadinii NRRL Y-1542]|uniref:Uncharacterized protein n=1 Tax=Cyberlindnera jadinii (strain ATCC 18201 / CBS 1600 / BCRC 20928 / JCM 3617 / NBRC 0987 / NRRL Y-1542) TaxID=983966 RepID=A0A1E4RV60_CYBJN|nr:hypothetical protein CYBJADRAFT_169574 [Cyberlindnera jadinii NRRL Y-1542]ODV71154.1 hypothetical protein CYBJADRAFT_169574 [Cyberlindnera jadinii NRRL Y-1542]